ncbi:caprin-2-like [Mercenaria mercenaria]|uniref:caprin-2-like n=1 Tax=Mercenaria mercenaria TaxID=6596 RepID=UPI00234F3901|nr:caprin-2-like [Mercenaria mercenaria]
MIHIFVTLTTPASSLNSESSSGELTLQSLQNEIDDLRADLEEERNRLDVLDLRFTEPKAAFHARVSPIIANATPDEPIIFSQEVTDIGGNYNTSSGEFVAPVDGVYVFFCTILPAWGKIIETNLQVNGGKQMWLYSGGKFRGSGSNLAVLNLSAGDVVNIAKNGIFGTQPFTVHHIWSTFSGFLLQPFYN